MSSADSTFHSPKGDMPEFQDLKHGRVSDVKLLDDSTLGSQEGLVPGLGYNRELSTMRDHLLLLVIIPLSGITEHKVNCAGGGFLEIFAKLLLQIVYISGVIVSTKKKIGFFFPSTTPPLSKKKKEDSGGKMASTVTTSPPPPFE